MQECANKSIAQRPDKDDNHSAVATEALFVRSMDNATEEN